MRTAMKNAIRQDMKRSAEISDCGQFRWWLQRRWADGPLVCFVMLNPSTADAEQDDPTIRRCIAFARSWGFGALSVRNLFPFRATKPADLKRAVRSIDVTGGQRGLGELAVAATADLVIAAWGANATECAAQRFYAPWFRSFPAEHVHRIRLGRFKECWTLVIVFAAVRPWGFWHEGKFIPWKEYVFGASKEIADEMKACH